MNMDEPVVQEIIKGYKQGKSIRAISRDAGISFQKARKILITLGLFSSPISEKVNELACAGLSINEIAEQLFVSPNVVYHYMSYQKGMCPSESPSKNTRAIRKDRSKKAVKSGEKVDITTARIAAGLSLEQLAEKSGVTLKIIQNAETGALPINLITERNLSAIAKALDIDPQKLI